MSYLNSLRLTFSGDFQADVATANNDVRHFDNDHFEPRFQEPGENNVNGAYNPDGGSAFQFRNCSIRSVSFPDGRILTNPADDFALGQVVSSPGDRLTGKLVDLDPQMQLSTELWGVKLRLVTAAGDVLLEGDILPSGFRDLQIRQYRPPANGLPLGALWTSVLYNIKWGDKAKDSKFLKQLKAKTQGDKLSLSLTSFGYYLTHNDNRFTIGKILGTIGPWTEGDPQQFIPSRRLFGIFNIGADNNPAVPFNYSNFVLDEENKKVHIDLGASFPLIDAFGGIERIWLKLAVAKQAFTNVLSTQRVLIAASSYETIGLIENTDAPGWLDATSGILTFALSTTAFNLLKNNQLLLIGKTPEGQETLIARESVGGYLVRADYHVFRLDPGDVQKGTIHTYRWGKPLPNTKVVLSLMPPAPIDIFSDPTLHTPIPLTGTPPEALSFTQKVKTDANGKAEVTVSGTDPGAPRVYVDGQIYYVNYQLEDVVQQDRYPFDQLLVHLRDDFPVPDKPKWRDIAPTLKLYGNIFPLMSKYVVDLGLKKEVIKRKEILLFAFTRDINDPNYMPVTRDLSEGKRKTIVKWLKNLKDEPPYDDEQDTDEVEHRTRKALKQDANAGDFDIDDYQKTLGRAKSGTKLSYDLTLPFASS